MQDAEGDRGERVEDASFTMGGQRVCLLAAFMLPQY